MGMRVFPSSFHTGSSQEFPLLLWNLDCSRILQKDFPKWTGKPGTKHILRICTDINSTGQFVVAGNFLSDVDGKDSYLGF